MDSRIRSGDGNTQVGAALDPVARSRDILCFPFRLSITSDLNCTATNGQLRRDGGEPGDKRPANVFREMVLPASRRDRARTVAAGAFLEARRGQQSRADVERRTD